MGSRIKDVYIVHHSHTDIGYTDLQEQIVYNQVNNIRNVISIIKKGCETGSQEKDFKWNCETYFCVEQYLQSASEEEKADFFELVRKGNIGISATYLNFNDLADLYMGEMESHPILLCNTIESRHSVEEHGIEDGRSVEGRTIEENNRRPIYSWIMNNTWETNFRMDLSGFGEFRYMLELQEGTLEENLTRLSENDLGMVSFITG